MCHAFFAYFIRTADKMVALSALLIYNLANSIAVNLADLAATRGKAVFYGKATKRG